MISLSTNSGKGNKKELLFLEFVDMSFRILVRILVNKILGEIKGITMCQLFSNLTSFNHFFALFKLLGPV